MPTYEYQCQACGKRFDLFQPITAAPVRKCPSCGRNKVRRLIGPGAGVLFKGSGFYQTDYRSDAYRKAAQKEMPSTSSASDSSKDTPSGRTDGEIKKGDSASGGKGKTQSC